jgi:hypothetical protein
MTFEEMKNLFKAEYAPASYKNLIKQLFPTGVFFGTPVQREIPQAKRAIAHAITQTGACTLADTSKIAFFEVTLAPGKAVAHNRVGLRDLLKNELQPGDIDGVFASFFGPGAGDWRISFLSKSLSWDNESRQLKLETNPRRYTFVVGAGETVATAVDRFGRLLNKAGHLKLDDVLEAFSVEKISDEFFEKYRHHFDGFVEFIQKSPSQNSWFSQKAKELLPREADRESLKKESEKLARNFVKKLLGRIVFLYFLQKKGWLGVPKNGAWGEGRRDFVSTLYKEFEAKNDFYAECLVPLFFSTLNKKRANDLFSITKTRIPYLNGGLFDQSPFEPLDAKFKAKLFEELFAFFDSYNFTIDENSPEDQDIGIDPEMLGHIFENLLEENLRSQKGTFYTPKDVVHYMCKEALRRHIREKLSSRATDQELKAIDAFIYELPEKNRDIVKTYASAMDAALSAVKICDPAIGSGAFPMGMVYEILRLKKELFGFLPGKKGFDYGKEKLAIIRNSIYGVDIDQGAIDIARLRFWLSLIVDEEEPRPLPNLDYKIMQGDSLREWYEDIPLHNLATEEDRPLFLEEPKLNFGEEYDDPQKKLKLSVSEKTELKELVNEYFAIETYQDKQRIRKQIDSVVDRHLKTNIAHAKNECLKKIENGHRLSAKQLEKEKLKLRELEEKEQRLIALETVNEKPFFLWNLFFGDVMVENRGFDIVIGNPPYGVKVDDHTEEFYGLGSKDSYGAFMSLGLKKLLKVNGTLCFIVSDTWLTIKSHLPLRKQVLEWQLQKVIRLHQDCFHATVNSCIVTVRKERFDKEKENAVIAADFTNISTRKDTAKFRERLLRVEELVGESTVEFGVYGYGQEVIGRNHNCPVFVGSPKLFGLMDDTGAAVEKRVIDEGKEVAIRKLVFNNRELELLTFGDVAEVKQGLATGDNDYYLYQNPEARGGYKDITLYKEFLLTEDDLDKIRRNDDLRLRVIDKGIHKTKTEKGFEKDRYFGERFIVPYDKGGESDTESGWLPNYYVPTDYFIDWSTEAIKRLKTYKIADRIRDKKETKAIKQSYKTTTAAVIRNQESYFILGITFSRTGIYSPSFRFNSSSIFDTEGSAIFLPDSLPINHAIAILSSRLYRYLLKNYIGHTVHTQVDELKDAPLVLAKSDKIEGFVRAITIKQQEQGALYDYFSHEQKTLDSLVYRLYNLSPLDINEVETWFARRYPKLARYADIKPPESLQPPATPTEDEKTARLKALILSGESRTVEFKQTLRYDVRAGQVNKELEWVCIKNIAAFLNSQGGTLFIGVRDDDGSITGLEDDFSTFGDANKKDAFIRHLDNIIAQHFGNAVQGLLSMEFPLIDGRTICAITVAATAPEPVYLKNSRKDNLEEFYIRRSASTVALTLRETVQFVNEHWPKSNG